MGTKERLKLLVGKKIIKIVLIERKGIAFTQDHLHIQCEDGRWFELFGNIGAGKKLDEKGPTLIESETTSVSIIEQNNEGQTFAP